jgi:uncharacterized LabA/DUF88 family protein
MPTLARDRVVVYIDGFNLYFGLKTKGWRQFYWLNLLDLSRHLLKPHQALVQVKYFTSRIRDDPPKERRQSTYIDALQTLPAGEVQIIFGKYQSEIRTCHSCGASYQSHNEKMTDVNIAVEMMADAFQNRFDTALLISADSDLTAPIATALRLFPSKRVAAAFPPARSSEDLKRVVSAHFTIGHGLLAKSIFSDSVVREDGFLLNRPASWR